VMRSDNDRHQTVLPHPLAPAVVVVAHPRFFFKFSKPTEHVRVVLPSVSLEIRIIDIQKHTTILNRALGCKCE
jgi:hypothetical protein